jgi:RNA polymerase sigma factor (sigma-70 family)
MSESATHAAIEAIARNSYGRLIAYIAARSGDVARAEDALGDAIAAALERWPADGVPQKPEAWLLHAARNRIIDAARRHQVQQQSETILRQITEEAHTVAVTHEDFPDERLKLLFVCAHPAIDPAARTPLMLQTVLGVDAARIASAFLVSPSAISQRLVRAKNKIRDAGIPFCVPEPREWNERVTFVLDAIYSAYTTGWESLMDVSSTHQALAGDAIAIARTLVQLNARPNVTCVLQRSLNGWDAINWKQPFNPFTPTGPSADVSTGRRSSCFMKAWCKSRPESVHLSGEPWRLHRQASLPRDFPRLKKFPPAELSTTSPIGPHARICCNCSTGTMKRRNRSLVPRA